MKTSVTKLIKFYKKPFERELIASRMAEKQGISANDILADWDLKAKESIERGKSIHKYIEDFTAFKKGKLQSAPAAENKYQHYIDMFTKFQQQANFDFKEGLTEVIIPGNIVGVIDFVYEDENKCANFIDWKTTGKFTTTSNYKYINGLEHLDDCSLVDASLQLWMYKILWEKVTSNLVKDLTIVVFSDNLKTYSALNLKDEAEFIINKASIIR